MCRFYRMLVFIATIVHNGRICGSDSYFHSFVSSTLNLVGYKPCWKSHLLHDKPALEIKALVKKHMFGQHIAADVAVKAVLGHIFNDRPKKALTLSFHGWTGCGKNHLANLIVQGLYKDGSASPYVHHFVGSRDINKYFKQQYFKTEEFQNDIENRLRRCERSLFIFDEVEFMDPDSLNALKPFLEYHEHNAADLSRYAIFIFLANTGATDISQITLDHFKSGLPRESLALKNFEKVVSSSSFNEKGGYSGSILIKSGLVDHFVPFLPLEKKHVLLCVTADPLSRHLSSAKINAVVDSLSFKPDDLQIYSETGCKRVQQKLILELHDEL